MKPILLTALLAFSTIASAGLPTSGLPSGNTDIAVHVSNETLDKTQIGKALTDAFTGEIDANKVVIALKSELGFELDEDFRDLTVVAKAGDEKSFVALVRGKFNKARIEAFAATNKVPNHTVKGLKAWDARALGDAIAKAAGTESSKENPNMTDEQITYAIAKLKETKVLTGGDAEKMGIGIITDARWKRTYDTMVGNGLLKADVDYRQAYTTQFVRDLKVMP